MKEILGHYITKIEGHGKLKVDFSKERAELHVDEGERLFEGLVLGRIYEDAPLISARICGVCPTAHTFAAIDALENALDIKVPEYIADYRRIMLSLQIFQSHVLHLFFLAAPDYLNIDSALDLAEKNPEVFQIVLDLKRLADEGIELIGGRSIHPVTPVVGGFTKLPDYRKLLLYRNRLEKNLVHAVEAAKLFAKFHYPHMEREREYLSLQDSSYPLIGEEVVSSAGKNFKVSDYQ
ncbi:MAG: Nickel-dependent hydrogenase large subunit, partial [candidate division CPR2 bacterium GW2011_GWC1_39_9]